MTRTPGRFLAVLLLSVLALSCMQVPFTGRSQLILVSNAEMLAMSYQEYDKFLKDNKPVKNTPEAQMVRRVGLRISAAVEKHFVKHNMASRLDGYAWEFNLVDSKEVNAWCMPGGKVVVYTGILPVAKDEAGLAVIVGHEIAHAVANHGNERMSQALLAAAGAAVLDEGTSEQNQQTRELFQAAYNLGASLAVMLPYSRLQEHEADRLGLIFSAMAGYDPQEGHKLWERMAALKKGGTGFAFLSTHPPDEERIQNLKRLAATEATQYYRPGN